MPQNRRNVLLGMLGACGLGTVFPGKASALSVSASEVNEAIERAVGFIKRAQRPDGTWPDRPNYEGGLTPLCLLALLNAGYGEDEAAVRRGLEQLDKFRPISTYAASLQTMVFCYVSPERYRQRIEENVRWLESKQVTDGKALGMWAFDDQGTADHIDNSMTHFAMLALYDAERVGVPVSEATWRLGLRAWNNNQNADGSWGWGPGYEGTGSMTCGGISAVLIATSRNRANALVQGDEIDCCQPTQTNPVVDRALTWLERNFRVRINPGSRFWLSYYLFSLERVGHLTSRRFIGKHDWYREGAEYLCQTQTFDGGWLADMDFEYGKDPIVSTAFSLLFLSKGRRPIVLAHLQHGPPSDWNPHQNALFNLVAHVEQKWKRTLTHQVVDLRQISPAELREIPVLFLNGRNLAALADAEREKLKEYLLNGGFLFAEQTCGDEAFDREFRAAVEAMFADDEFAKLRLLAEEHPAWYAEQQVPDSDLLELWGLDIGCRTAIIYCPHDLSCRWEIGRVGREDQLPYVVRNQVKVAQAIGANILAYATDRKPKFKDPGKGSQTEESQEEIGRGLLQIVEIRQMTNAAIAAHATENLLNQAAEHLGIRTTPQATLLSLEEVDGIEQPFLFFHGNRAFSLSAIEREKLKQFLQRGGFVFANAVGGNEAFAKSFRREIDQLFPGKFLQAIPDDSLLLTDQLGGYPIEKVPFRSYARKTDSLDSPLVTQPVTPVLEGLDFDGHYGVVFSPIDLSCLLSSSTSMLGKGYRREDAIRIAINVLVYAFNH